MDDSYIIAHEAGTSGRFIGYIIWSLLTNSTDDFQITTVNSAHFYDFFIGTDCHNMDSAGSNIYEEARFNNDAPIKIIRTHIFPKVDLIAKRFPDTKIILISFTKDDALEVVGNNLYKNCLADEGMDLQAKNILERTTMRVFQKNILKENLTLEQIQVIVETETNWDFFTTDDYSLFVNPSISIPNLLILPYQEIYLKNNNEEYIGLKKLEDFTSIKANETAHKNYEKYVKGRDIFISTKMPWLKHGVLNMPWLLNNKTLNP
jgi:hypothetical protein